MKRGFTLIELMVSIAIFSVVMVISLGSLLSVSAAERKAETIKSVMTNLNFALESMSRTIRTGSNYHCGSDINSGPQDCDTTPQSYIALTAVDGSKVAYCLDGTTIKRQILAAGGGALSTTCSDANSFLAMTAPEVKVSSLSFYVKGACSSTGGSCTADTIQPKVTISLTGFVSMVTGSTASSTFNIQTTVTQRIYDQ